MAGKFTPGDVIRITCMNSPNKYAIVISEDRYRELSGYSGERYEPGSIFYQISEREVDVCNGTFLKVSRHIKKSSLERALSDLGKQSQSIQASLKFLKSKK